MRMPNGSVIASIALSSTVVCLVIDLKAQTQAELHSNDRKCIEGDMNACNSAGVEYDRRKQYREAAQRLMTACSAGLALACSNLAELYYDGRGVQEDQPRALQLFSGACKEKNANGCAGYCLFYLKQPDANQQTTANCQTLLSRVCENGNPWMCGHIGSSVRSPPGRVGRRPCPDDSARVLGRAYALSNPFFPPGDIIAYVAQNRSYFIEGGGAVRCAHLLGRRLVSAGDKAYDEGAYERVTASGFGEHAQSVADSINSGAVDLHGMGEELLWLSNVLPIAARGTWDQYETGGSGARQQLRELAALLRGMESMGLDAGMSQFARQLVARLFTPLAEEQVLMLARMLE